MLFSAVACLALIGACPSDEAAAKDEMWKNVEALGDPSISRVELLTRFERFVQRHPGTEYHGRARRAVDILRRMVAEDEECRSTPPRGETVEETIEAKVDRLIFELRDLNARQYSQPGDVDIFRMLDMSAPDAEPGPVEKLLALRYAAVPGLIEAMEDDSFTRSVGYHRNFYFSHYVVRVGSCARQILERITWEEFDGACPLENHPGGGPCAPARDRARHWWREVSAVGVDEYLAAKVESGKGARFVTLLQEQNPERTFEAVIVGLERAADEEACISYLRALTHFDDDQGVPQLLEHLRHGEDPTGILVVALQLHHRGYPEGFRAIVELWGSAAALGPRDRKSILGFLTHCGLEGFNTIGDGFGRHPAEFREEIIEKLGERAFHLIQSARRPEASSNPGHFEDLRTLATIEELLVEFLGDEDGSNGPYALLDGKARRICEVAAETLAGTWPARYSFDPQVSFAELDAAVLGCREARLRASSPALVPPVVEKAGSRSAPIVIAWPSATVENPAPVPAAPAAELRRINTVTEVAVVGEVEPGEALAARFASLRDRPLRGEDVAELLRTAPDEFPGHCGLSLAVDRLPGRPGIIVRARLIEEAGDGSWWQTALEGSSGGEGICGSFGISRRDIICGAVQWASLSEQLDRALADPKKRIFLRADLRPSR